jgi:ankyrin repeat protein
MKLYYNIDWNRVNDLYSNLRIVYFIYSHDQDGWTPLYVAAKGGLEGIVQELIAGGANINQAANVSNIIYICNNIPE